MKKHKTPGCALVESWFIYTYTLEFKNADEICDQLYADKHYGGVNGKWDKAWRTPEWKKGK